MQQTKTNQETMPKDAPDVTEALNKLRFHQGPLFEEMYGDQMDSKISITGGAPDHRQPGFYEAFDDCVLNRPMRETTRLLQLKELMPVQKSVIPLIQKTKADMIVQAPTGSGKTAAFMLPIIDKIHRHKVKYRVPKVEPATKPFAIIISPTKELAEQLHRDAKAFANNTVVSVKLALGHTPLLTCLNEVQNGCDLLVATCGRLKHLIEDEHIKLERLGYVILDEADRLIQTVDDFYPCIRELHSHPGTPLHRTLMFSATYTKAVLEMASRILRRHYYIVSIGEPNRPVESVKQSFVLLGHHQKQAHLLEILMKGAKKHTREDGTFYHEPAEKMIVFVDQKRESDRLAVVIAQAGFMSISINADRTTKQRCEAIEKFQQGVYHVLVATDALSRGMSFPGVNLVISYDLPRSDELTTYIHRVGRTGRVGNVGEAISFFDPNSQDRQNAPLYVEMLKHVGQEVPAFLRVSAKIKKAARSLPGDQVDELSGAATAREGERVWF